MTDFDYKYIAQPYILDSNALVPRKEKSLYRQLLQVQIEFVGRNRYIYCPAMKCQVKIRFRFYNPFLEENDLHTFQTFLVFFIREYAKENIYTGVTFTKDRIGVSENNPEFNMCFEGTVAWTQSMVDLFCEYAREHCANELASIRFLRKTNNREYKSTRLFSFRKKIVVSDTLPDE